MMKILCGARSKKNASVPFPSTGKSFWAKWKEKYVRKKILSSDKAIFLFFSLLNQCLGPRGLWLLLTPRQYFFFFLLQLNADYRVARACTHTLLGNHFLRALTLFLVLHHLWGTITLIWPLHHFLSHHFLSVLWPHDALAEVGNWPCCWTKLFR